MTKKKKNTTYDKLAHMIARSFEGFETRMDENLKAVETHVNENVNLLRRDTEAGFEDIKHILKPHGKTIFEHTAELTDHDERLGRVEKKIGLSK